MGIVAKNLFKKFGTPETTILNDINLRIDEGEFIAITGRSGSGKSTLLYVLSTLDHPSSGSIEIENQLITTMKPQQLDHFRNTKLGFIFQFHYLISELSAIENVLLPAKKAGKEKELTHYAYKLLKDVGLENKENRLPRHLSGGEQQRVAIARSLILSPKYLFADEPTGSLDSVNGKIIMDIIKKINLENNTTIILVTHDAEFAQHAKRKIYISDGKIL